MEKDFQKSCEIKTGIYVTFAKIKLFEGQIFKSICPNCVRLQQCSDVHLYLLFGGKPEMKDLNMLGALEEMFGCAGLCDIKLGKYMFSDYNR